MYRFWAFSVKHATQQKFESLRATFLPKLHNMVNSNSDFIQSMLNSLQNGGCLFIITTLLVHTINATISSKNQFFSSVNFHPAPLLVHQIIFTIPANILFLYTSTIFHLLLFAYKHPNNVHQKYFPYLNHFASSDRIEGPVGLAVF